jgi:hypothetical protein
VPDDPVAGHAEAVLRRARDHQPDVRRIIDQLVMQAGGILAGIEFEFKSRESLERKIRSNAEVFGLTLNEAADRINDSLRYTMVAQPSIYRSSVDAVLRGLLGLGWQMWIKNTWSRGAAYMGINVGVRTGSGFTFEIQFHTEESLRIKELSHLDYEAQRVTRDRVEWARLAGVMVARWEGVEIPPGAEDITDDLFR